MTDTTDKLSLQQLKDVRELCLPHTAWRSIIDELISARDQLEAERQRADNANDGWLKVIAERDDLKAAQIPFTPVGVIMKRLPELEAENAELRAKLANPVVASDVIRDANRYRFLRDEDAWGEDSDSWDFETRTGLISSENLMGGLASDQFDAAIDARMAASDIPFFNPVTSALNAKNSEWRERAEAAEKERDELKAAHGNMVSRCALLRQRNDLPVDRIPAYNALVKAQDEIAALKVKLANSVVLTDCTFEAVSHMAHWYSEGECVAWVSGVEHVKKQILEAGFTVKGE